MTNVDLWRAEIERVPLRDDSVDPVISNEGLNLCPDEPRVLGEVYRFLEPGGRFQMADILLEPHVTPAEVASKGSWSDWIAGALWERSLLEMLARAGFAEARVHRWTGYRTSSCTEGALVSAIKQGALPADRVRHGAGPGAHR